MKETSANLLKRDVDEITVLFLDAWSYYFTVSLDLPNTIKVSGGKLPATYKALQVHYHWGKDGGPGAEHTIDGEQYPMEVKKKKINHFYVVLHV